MSAPPDIPTGWTFATPEEAAAFQRLARPSQGNADPATRKRQRMALASLLSGLARDAAWPRLTALLSAIPPDVMLPPEQFKFAVKSLRANIGPDATAFAASIWPATDPGGAAAAILGVTCHKLGLKQQAVHYLEAAHTALGAALPALAFHDWCRNRLMERSYAEVASETGRYLAQDPHYAAIAILHAQALQELGQIEEAIARLSALPPAAGKDGDARARQLARLFLRDGRPEEALATLTIIDPGAGSAADRIDTQLIEADALLALGKPADAAKIIADEPPGSIDSARRDRLAGRKARILLAEGRIAEAMSLLGESDSSVDLLRKKIIIGILLGDLDAVRRAEDSLSRALIAGWRPGRASPGYNQHLMFARNTRLNAAFADLCNRIGNLGDQSAMAHLRPYLQRHPLDYSAGIQLVFRMSRLGLLSRKATASAGGIPKRLMFFWDETNRPPSIDRLIRSWPAANPDYAVEIFDDVTAKAWLEQEFGARHARAFSRAQNAAMKSDFFRLCYLFRSGGIYADCDDRCRAPLDDWLEGRDAVLYQENHLSFAVANNFMACAPAQPWLGDAIEHALLALEAPVRSFTFYVTGPGLLTMCFAQWLLKADETSLLKTRLLRASEYAGKVSPHVHVPYKATARHWVRQEGAGA